MSQIMRISSGALLSSTTITDMKTAASTALYIVPLGRVLRIQSIVVRDLSATPGGGATSYSVTGWRQTFSLATLVTVSTGYITVRGADLAQYTEQAAGTTINFTVTTGTTNVVSAVVDLFGYLT